MTWYVLFKENWTSFPMRLSYTDNILCSISIFVASRATSLMKLPKYFLWNFSLLCQSIALFFLWYNHRRLNFLSTWLMAIWGLSFTVTLYWAARSELKYSPLSDSILFSASKICIYMAIILTPWLTSYNCSPLTLHLNLSSMHFCVCLSVKSSFRGHSTYPASTKVIK